MRNNLAQGVYWEFTNDIDMASFGNWIPIGYYDGSNWLNGFNGNVDGKGYVVKNLTININNGNGMYTGLFGQYFYGTMQNLGLVDPQINKTSPNVQRLAGGLVGYSYQGKFKNCYVKGGSITVQDTSGGFIGNALESTFNDCYTDVNVIIKSNQYGGGFVGQADSKSKFTNCYSKGNVTYDQNSPWNGFSGFSGFVRDGADAPTFASCYWDKETSGQPNTAKMGNPNTITVTGLTGKTTAEMKTKSTYTGWDFTNTWYSQGEYPTLLIFGVPKAPPKQVTVTVNSHSLPLFANSSKSKKSIKQLNTYANTLVSHSGRVTATIRNVTIYSSQINTSALSSHRSVRSRVENLQSTISPFYSSIYRNGVKYIGLTSYMKPIHGDVSVSYPISNKVVNAYVSYVRNPSNASEVSNVSQPSYVENPSYVEVIL